MAVFTEAELISKISAAVLTGGNRTKAVDVRQLLSDVLSSYPNRKDAGLVFQSELGYSSAISPTSDYSFATKHYVDAAIAESGGGGGITGLGANGFLILVNTSVSGNISTVANSSIYESSGNVLIGYGGSKTITLTSYSGFSQSSVEITSSSLFIGRRNGASTYGLNFSGQEAYFDTASMNLPGVVYQSGTLKTMALETPGYLYSDGGGTLSWEYGGVTAIGTENFLPVISSTLSGAGTYVLTMVNSRFYDDGSTVLYADAGTAGKLSASNSSKAIGIYSQTSDSYIYIDGDTASTFNGTRIHSTIQNAVTGKHFSFISVSGINDNTVAIFSPDTHGTKLVSSSITSAELNNISGGTSNFQNQINNLNLGLSAKNAARVLVSSNVNISSPGSSLDSVAMVAGDRVVLNGQSTGSQNGVYDWNGAAVAMTRSADCTTGGFGGTGVLGMTILIMEGTNADQLWMLTTDAPITIGSTTLSFSKSSNTTYTGSDGIVLTGNNFTLNNAYFSGAFTMSAGVATIGAGYVTNSMLANSSVTVNGTSIALGASATISVAASSITAGTFGSGAYTMGTSLSTPSLIGTSGQLAFTSVAQSSGAIIDYLFTPSNHTGQTASTNTPVFRVASSTKTLATGALTAWYANHFQTQTIAFAGASTLTDGFGAYFENVTAGTNATITNNYSLGTSGFVKFGSGLSGVIIRNDVSTNNYVGFYNANAAPTGSNYFLKSSGSVTQLNASTTLILSIATSGILTFIASSATFAQSVILRAGTATAATYPLAFQSGTNLTTPVNGVMEYNGTNLFFTRAAATRENIMCASAVNSVSPTAPDRTITTNINGTTYYIAAKTTND